MITWTPLLRDGRPDGSSPRRLLVRPMQAVAARPPCLGTFASSIWTRLCARAATLPPPCSFLRLACLFSRPGRGCPPARWRRSVIRGAGGHAGRSTYGCIAGLVAASSWGSRGGKGADPPRLVWADGRGHRVGIGQRADESPMGRDLWRSAHLGGGRSLLHASSQMSQRAQGLQLAFRRRFR